MARHKPSLIHRGYLYAQKRIRSTLTTGDYMGWRWATAEAWKQGYLQARRDAKKT